MMRKKFERFCYKYNHYGVRNLAIWLVGVNIAMFALDIFLGGELTAALFFDPGKVLGGQWWRVFSFLLIPDNPNPIFLFFELLLLYWFISSLEHAFGRLKLTIYYFSGLLMCVLFAALSVGLWAAFPQAWFFNPGRAYSDLLTTGDLNLSIMLAFATFYPDMQIRVFFVLPVKVKWLAIVGAALLGYRLLIPPHTFLSLFPLVAVANYLVFFAADFVKTFFKRQKSAGRMIRFEKAAKDIRRTRGYTHKCAVCEITDADSPGMEFRYCSLCSTYQCYCSKHIFEHEHK